MIQAGQLRGGELIPAALTQLCRRTWRFKGDRRAIETKEDFKAANNGRSPDDADVLCGAIEMARRRGFRFERKRNTGPQRGGLVEKLQAMRSEGTVSRKFAQLGSSRLHG